MLDNIIRTVKDFAAEFVGSIDAIAAEFAAEEEDVE